MSVRPYYDVFVQAVQWIDKPDIPTWADNHRVITKGAEKGPWRTSRTPYLKQIMYSLSPQSIDREVIVIKPTQMGFTEVGINAVLYYADVAPLPSLMIFHTQTIAENASQNRINPSIQKIPNLRDKITPAKKKGDGGKDLSKVYPDGYLELKWGQTPSSFASIPAGVVICDDIDRWPQDVGDEGNPLDLARGRAETFSNSKFYANSTPTTELKSNISKEFEASNKSHYYMPCPECTPRDINLQNRENMVIFEWKYFKFERDEHGQRDGDVTFCCPHCGSFIKEEKKEWMMSEEAGARWIAHIPSVRKIGYRITGMYQPLGMGRDWNIICDRFLAAHILSEKGDFTKLKTVTNTIFAEPWKDELTKIEISLQELMDRRETYKAEVPEGVYLLCAGVDTHKDRFEIETVGYGKEGQTWGIEKTVINGDPALPETKKSLDEYLLRKTFIHESGSQMKIYCSTVDYGGLRSKSVSIFTGKRYVNRVYAIKGATAVDAPFVNKVPTKTKYKTRLFMLGVNDGKNDFFSRVVLSDKGSNYCHFPQSYPEQYFEQLLVEKQDANNRWVNPSKARNEALDCRIYADAAYGLSGKDVDVMSKPLFLMETAPQKRRRVISRGIRK